MGTPSNKSTTATTTKAAPITSETEPPTKKAKSIDASKTASLSSPARKSDRKTRSSNSSASSSRKDPSTTTAPGPPPFPALPSDTIPSDSTAEGNNSKSNTDAAKAKADATEPAAGAASVVTESHASGTSGSSESGHSSKESLSDPSSSSSSAIPKPAPNYHPSESSATEKAAPPKGKPSETTAPAAPSVPPLSKPPPPPAPPNTKDAAAPPLKSTTMGHLKTKYTAELEYMLREFRKLERQLLGANRASASAAAAGEQPESRERREKLHSFILHLEDTLSQIELGCKLEAEGKTTVHVGVTPGEGGGGEGNNDAAKSSSIAQAGALCESSLSQEKEEEENVQKLEEHILANLLPVKVRLKKQLAAQQGATRNPAGMPAPRRGSWQPSAAADRGKGTFAAAAEQKRRAAEEARLAEEEKQRIARRISDPTQFGKPLSGGGSSLTQKLHGATLGSKKRPRGHGVGSTEGDDPEVSSEAITERKILYAGMVPQSSQHETSIAAASGAHDMVVTNPAFKKKQKLDDSEKLTKTASEKKSSAQRPKLTPKEQERHTAKKNKRKRKLLKLARRREKERQRQVVLQQQQAAQVAQAPAPKPPAVGRKKVVAAKSQGKKKGPKAVEYVCALCNEPYASTCEYNPWWAVVQHECPKCRKSQIPRIDISSPANAIEYHPALLAHLEESGNGGSSNPPSVQVGQTPASSASAAAPSNVPQAVPAPSVQKYPSLDDLDSDSDMSELSDDSLSDCSLSSDDSCADIDIMTPAEQAEYETFGADYKGPVLPDDEAAKLVVLMCHASTCPCNHKNENAKDVCLSTKYMMLHIRDCPGTTSTYDVCPFPWCRKAKHLLYHLVSCRNPKECAICSPKTLPRGLATLVGLNAHRFKKRREKMVAATKAANAAARKSRQAGGNSKKSSSKNSQNKSSSGAGAARKSSQPKKLPAKASASKPAPKAAPKPAAVSQPAIPAPVKPAVPVQASVPEQPDLNDPLAMAALAASASENSVSTTELAKSIAAQIPHDLAAEMGVSVPSSIPGPSAVLTQIESAQPTPGSTTAKKQESAPAQTAVAASATQPRASSLQTTIKREPEGSPSLRQSSSTETPPKTQTSLSSLSAGAGDDEADADIKAEALSSLPPEKRGSAADVVEVGG